MTDQPVRFARVRKVARLGVIPLVSAVIVAATVAAVLLVRANQHDADTATARREAPPAAGETVSKMLSYTADDVDKQLGSATGLTGSFQDDYRSLVTKTIAPVAKQKGITTRAHVVAVGVLAAAPQRVTLLMYIDQVTVSTAVPAPTTSSSRVTVTAEKHANHWLVSGMTPL
ncbi:hypothetical protein NONO_c32810 [Nocardia nova SH22a]|uniref:Mce-associated membrane protein n=1 Tax=Nocardia nova SH22a TaxID=1415166 RepID=W5TGF3_9NOCA|nr:hypothetical protein [Nocardia nova]AHH18068.1 hypothetical protein NONO_c32810 [Nocardia nova SH22a]